MRSPSVMAELAAFDLDAEMVAVVGKGNVPVPPYPAVAMKVQALVKREDYGLEDLIRLVSSDQALAADALRCANSAFYSRGIPVATLPAAVSRIGGKELARLAMASGLGSLARKPGPLASLRRRIWLDSLAAAALCQELGRHRRLEPEVAFICGLLHDFGRMVGMACVEEILSGHPGMRPMPLEYWLNVVERYHVELGLVLAARWDLPAVVSDAISLHHADDWTGAVEPRLVELVAAADDVVRLLDARAHLTPEDLGTAAALAAAECQLVSRVLDRIPAFVASFEGEAAAPLVGASLVAPPEPPEEIAAGPTPADFDVLVTVGREQRTCHAMGIATNVLMVHGDRPLPENSLLAIELRSPEPISCWATAKLSWAEDGGHTIILQPFALNGAAHDVWKALLRTSTPQE